jgi:hypothetical protein
LETGRRVSCGGHVRVVPGGEGASPSARQRLGHNTKSRHAHRHSLVRRARARVAAVLSARETRTAAPVFCRHASPLPRSRRVPRPTFRRARLSRTQRTHAVTWRAVRDERARSVRKQRRRLRQQAAEAAWQRATAGATAGAAQRPSP